MLLFFIGAKTLIFNTPSQKIQSSSAIETTSKEDVEPGKQAASLSFANEKVPVKDARVNWRMTKMLKAHSYKSLQTHRLHQKASKWFPIMEPILQYYGIPEDFKYIPLVESGLLSGTSSKGASGYWQFMPQTARDYGLKVNGNVDERQQVRKSTIAACKYIRSLYTEFHNWTLVAAAYNIGETKLKHQMALQNKHSYFKIKLNRETASYVYKLVSMKQIIENPALYGFSKSKTLIAKNTINTEIPRSQFTPDIERKAMSALSILRN
ncbi:MAG: Lytic transglycosylase catalytic [Sphingobacteriales bacterium]|nr:Lytic transglycosylase catalytic [Sphingobacteriales bacterium]